MLHCFIADDEDAARERLKRLLARVATALVVGEAADGVSTLEQVASKKPSVLLLDIEMPELDGLGVASALSAMGSAAPAIVFITAYDQHALRAFELAALDYLVKPVNEERLRGALAKVERMRPEVPLSADGLRMLSGQLRGPGAARRMAVRCGAKFIVFDPARVYGVLARDHYCVILLDGKELLADDPLEQLERRLGSDQFIRVHRSAIINLTLLRELVHEGDRRYVAVLADPQATRVPVSRERLPALKAALGVD